MADVVGPGGAAVGLAGEGLFLGCSLRCPRTAQTGRRERAEEPPVCSLRLDDHEALVLALDGVDLHISNRLLVVSLKTTVDDVPKLPGKSPMGMLAR